MEAVRRVVSCIPEKASGPETFYPEYARRADLDPEFWEMGSKLHLASAFGPR